MVFANDFHGKNDSEILNAAIQSRGADGIVVIAPRAVDGERDYWLLDHAILLPENTTVILQNAKIKLSDACRDNFFRTANCGIGIEDPQLIRNVHIRGEGFCLLEGADHPRATGDSTKSLRAPCPHLPEDACKAADWIPAERRSPEKLTFADIHDYSYGTDAGREEESQYGDWRGIGILFANVDGFSISGLRIKESHGWGISLEACSNGRIEKIDFDARMHKMIDGMVMNMENQDGVDLRNGCHHIVISDITGTTGDDVIALTAIAANKKYTPGGSFRSTHVMHNDWTRRDRDIHDIIIRNVIARSYLCCTVRLLPAMTHIYNVVIDGIIDTRSADAPKHYATLLLGDGCYGENWKDSLRNLSISNVICNTKHPIYVAGYLSDSVIANVVNTNPDCEMLKLTHEDGLNHVLLSNVT
ncbi:MAG: hypothetical protein IKA76_04335 [Clostridia bacterium]|nr:hypothetical protein [Clostridia bacterium]